MEYEEKIVDSKIFRDVMGRFATGVTIVTVQESGTPHGMTVNSFTSVSLNPVLILICLDKEATTTNYLNKSDKFAINILGAHQERLARRFAENDNERDRFSELDYRLSDEGIPIINDTLGYLICDVRERIDGGDHIIFIGEVSDLEKSGDDHRPLLYYRGNYKSLAE